MGYIVVGYSNKYEGLLVYIDALSYEDTLKQFASLNLGGPEFEKYGGVIYQTHGRDFWVPKNHLDEFGDPIPKCYDAEMYPESCIEIFVTQLRPNCNLSNVVVW